MFPKNNKDKNVHRYAVKGAKHRDREEKERKREREREERKRVCERDREREKNFFLIRLEFKQMIY